MVRSSLLYTAILFTSLSAAAQQTGVAGSWREPGGSVIRIAPCDDAICATLSTLSRSVPTPFDGNNPDPAKRTRRLCGLTIGYGFHLTDPTYADGGHLYDPKSGRTYQGEMRSTGDILKLRGYVLIKAFGRTETWTRVNGPQASCE